jgi:hypothetical protein
VASDLIRVNEDAVPIGQKMEKAIASHALKLGDVPPTALGFRLRPRDDDHDPSSADGLRLRQTDQIRHARWDEKLDG